MSSGDILMLSGRKKMSNFKGVFNMYFLGVLLYIVFLVILSAFSSPASALLFVDLPSFIVILALTLPMLMASGLLSDFFKGFMLMGKKVNYYSSIDLKRIIEADKLAIQTLIIAGGIGAITGTISLLSNISDMSKFGPSLAIAMITVLYSLIFISVILPVKAKVSTILKTLEQEQDK